MNSPSFSVLDRSATELLDRLAERLSAQELQEVDQFVRVGEYGLALQTLVDILVEEKKIVSSEIYGLIEAYAATMQMAHAINWDQLRARLQ